MLIQEICIKLLSNNVTSLKSLALLILSKSMMMMVVKIRSVSEIFFFFVSIARQEAAKKNLWPTLGFYGYSSSNVRRRSLRLKHKNYFYSNLYVNFWKETERVLMALDYFFSPFLLCQLK